MATRRMVAGYQGSLRRAVNHRFSIPVPATEVSGHPTPYESDCSAQTSTQSFFLPSCQTTRRTFVPHGGRSDSGPDSTAYESSEKCSLRS